MKVNKGIRKGSLRSNQGNALKQHSAEAPPVKAISQANKLDLLDDLSAANAERAPLDTLLPLLRERVAFKIPSDIKYLDSVLGYLDGRMRELGLVDCEESEVVVALDEAIVNAIRHGNKCDARKAVHIVAELSSHEACFTVTDEGPGFSREDVPDPTDPSRLLEPNGRGLHLISHIMDEVCYNKCGNEIRMVKRARIAAHAESPAEKD